MDANKIKIGTKFDIEIPHNNNSNSSSTYSSQLIDIIDSKTISIVAPMNEGRFKFLTRGLTIFIYYLNERQDLLYFKAIVKGHRKNGPLDAFDITIDSEVSKIQRRKYYRLDIALSCQYKIIGEQLLSTDKLEFSEINNADLITAFTKNISGSGFCLNLEEPLNAGTILDITINLDNTALIRVFAQVIRSIHIQNKKYEVGIHYLKIEPRDSDILTKFIFVKQRLILKNTMQAKMNNNLY
ncbi:MAG: flagellar brake protein [Ruminiclostridium sp.]